MNKRKQSNQTLETILNKYPITSDEYILLDNKFGKLCHYVAWELKKKNSQNSLTNDIEDDTQELRIALIRAGSYYKRQCFIESSFETLDKYVKDKFIKAIVKELKNLWENRRRHGANRQKFGEFQEIILEKLVKKYVPKNNRPSIKNNIIIDSKFATYCKQIIWNAQKSLGKQITRDKSWRTGLVSLSEFDYLGSPL